MALKRNHRLPNRIKTALAQALAPALIRALDIRVADLKAFHPIARGVPVAFLP